MKKLLFAVAVASLAMSTGATTVTQAWRINLGDRDWLATPTDTMRSTRYNVATDHVTIVSRDVTYLSSPTLSVISAADGSTISQKLLDETQGGTFSVNKHGHDTDGNTYIGNLTRNWSTDAFRIYRVQGETGILSVAYASTSTLAGTVNDSARLGDTLEVIGSGVDTQIWVGIRTVAGPHLAKFTTTDGLTFSPTTLITIAGTYAAAPVYRGLSVNGTVAAPVVWVHDWNQIALRVNSQTGAVEDTIDAAQFSLVTQQTAIEAFSAYGLDYVAFAPGSYPNQASESGYIVKLAGGSKSVVANTESLHIPGINNGNATSAIDFDPVRSNLVIGVTNNSVSAHHIAAGDVTRAQDWQLLQ